MSHTFTPEEWDPVAEFPMPHLSFMIKLYLPKRNIGFHRTKKAYEFFKQKFEDISIDSNVMPFLAGSVAEGLSLPNTIVKTGSSEIVDKTSEVLFADIDVMWIARFKKIGPEDLADGDFADYFAITDYNYTHPGYLRLRLIRPETTSDDIKVYDSDRDCFYILGGANIWSAGHLDCSEINSTTKFEVTGPSMMVSDCHTPTTENYRNTHPEADNVISFHCPSWPRQAEAWPNRSRPCGWPDQKTINHIVKQGCYVVSVAHRKSKKPEVEWRLSFCPSERYLATNAVTDAQRQCYIFMKILHHQIIKPLQLISSYHLKNILFFSCEIIPSEQWEENPGACVMYMLDELILRIERKDFPHYFVPENNMIDYMLDDQISLLGSVLSNLRHNLIEIFLTFTDKYIPGNVGFLLPTRYQFRSILEDAQKFKDHRDLSKSTIEGFYAAGSTVAHVLMREGKPIEAIDVFEILHKLLLSRSLLDMDLVSFLMAQILYFANIKEMIDYMNVIEQEYADDSQYSAVIRGNIACLYHAHACSLESSCPEKETALSKADMLFQAAIGEEIVKSVQFLDYAIYLVDQNKYEEAVPILNRAISLETEAQSPSTVVFSKVECTRLDPFIRDVVGESKMFRVSTLVFVQYLLIVCTINSTEKEKQKLEPFLEELKRLCEVLPSKNSYLILSLVLEMLGKDGADVYKEKASSMEA